jgi:acyl carrier protein
MTPDHRRVPVRAADAATIEAEFARIVGESLRIDPALVRPSARLDDLGAESIDLVEIALEVENTFSIAMPERTVLDAVRDVLGYDAAIAGGAITDAASRLLRKRLPDVDPVRLAAGTPVAEVHRVFLGVDVWHRMIAGIVAQSPRACPRCGGGLVQGSPARVRCPACAEEFALPSADDLTRAWVEAEVAATREAP